MYLIPSLNVKKSLSSALSFSTTLFLKLIVTNIDMNGLVDVFLIVSLCLLFIYGKYGIFLTL